MTSTLPWKIWVVNAMIGFIQPVLPQRQKGRRSTSGDFDSNESVAKQQRLVKTGGMR